MHTDLHRGGGIQTCIEREYNQTCTEAYRLAQRNTDSHRGGGIQTDLHRGGMQMHKSVSADHAKLPSVSADHAKLPSTVLN